jgi:hypothetical protein
VKPLACSAARLAQGAFVSPYPSLTKNWISSTRWHRFAADEANLTEFLNAKRKRR